MKLDEGSLIISAEERDVLTPLRLLRLCVNWGAALGVSARHRGLPGSEQAGRVAPGGKLEGQWR